MFPNFGVGVNLSPLFNNDISVSVSFLLDKFIILMSLSIIYIPVGVYFYILGPGLGSDPDLGLDSGPGLGLTYSLDLKKSLVHCCQCLCPSLYIWGQYSLLPAFLGSLLEMIVSQLFDSAFFLADSLVGAVVVEFLC